MWHSTELDTPEMTHSGHFILEVKVIVNVKVEVQSRLLLTI